MKKLIILVIIGLFVGLSAKINSNDLLEPEANKDNSCISCHGGIEHIREPESEMMQAIFDEADKAGFKGNDCIVCHGGNPKTKAIDFAHAGTVPFFKSHKGPKDFYPDPGKPVDK